MDDGSSRDLRFGLGLALFGVGGPTVLGFGIAKSTNDDLQLWPNPWFIAALVLTILGAVTLIQAWIRTLEKDEPQLSQPVIVIPRRREGFPNWEAGHDVRDGGVLLRTDNRGDVGRHPPERTDFAKRDCFAGVRLGSPASWRDFGGGCTVFRRGQGLGANSESGPRPYARPSPPPGRCPRNAHRGRSAHPASIGHVT
jgi:hypothetical protein